MKTLNVLIHSKASNRKTKKERIVIGRLITSRNK